MQFLSSWDDGYALDLKVAEMLDRHDMKGTFYVCPHAQHGTPLLSANAIRQMAERHTIGAHTITHPRLTRIAPDKAFQEIRDGKAWVEEITGKPCTSFCYPYGDVNPAVRDLVAKAGFRDARTTEDLRFSSDDPFLQPVTLQVAPFPWRRRFHPTWKVLDPLGPLRSKFVRLQRIGIPLSAMTSWLSLAKALFDHAVQTKQPFFHLYGHSREVEKYGMWGEMEGFLSYARRCRTTISASIPKSVI